ncbi:MAG: hypothetical protein ACR2GH_12335 [Pseudonocardia sp.]
MVASYLIPALSGMLLVLGLVITVPIAVVLLTAARSRDAQRQANSTAVLDRLLAVIRPATSTPAEAIRGQVNIRR